MNSALYHGTVVHRRLRPRHHAFRYRLHMVLLDLDELDSVFRGRWLWSTRRPATAWFRRADHFGDPQRPLAEVVRDEVERQAGRRPRGPIRLLTQLRYFGYCFNPISIYYCHGADGTTLEATVAEVTSTPWGERHCYVVAQATPPATCTFSKRMHVSPFMPMDLEYLWRAGPPGDRIDVHMAVRDGAGIVFEAALALSRRPVTGTNLARALTRHPLMTVRVILAIYWQALRLWLKGVPVHAHPRLAASPRHAGKGSD